MKQIRRRAGGKIWASVAALALALAATFPTVAQAGGECISAVSQCNIDVWCTITDAEGKVIFEFEYHDYLC